MPRDIKLDPVTHDIVIEEGRISYVEGPERLLQAARIRCRTGLGEWPFDLDAGVGYTQTILTMPAQLQAATGEVARVLLQDPEITRIVELVPDFDPETRHLTINGTLATIYGELAFNL